MIIGFASRRIVTLWVGASNYGGDLLVWITVASVVVLSLFHISSIILVADLQVKVVSSTRLIEAILNVGLSVSLIRMGLGLAGVARGHSHRERSDECCGHSLLCREAGRPRDGLALRVLSSWDLRPVDWQ